MAPLTPLMILQAAIAGGNILSSFLKTKKQNESLNKAQATILSNMIGEGKTSARLQQMDMATETAMGGAMANAFAQGAAIGVKNIAPYVASANAELLSNAMQNKTQYLAETDKLNAQLAAQHAQLETQREDPVSALLNGAMQGTMAALQLESLVGHNKVINKIFKVGTGGVMDMLTKKDNETETDNGTKTDNGTNSGMGDKPNLSTLPNIYVPINERILNERLLNATIFNFKKPIYRTIYDPVLPPWDVRSSNFLYDKLVSYFNLKKPILDNYSLTFR